MNSFGAEVDAVDEVAYPVAAAGLIEGCDDRVIGGYFGVRCRRSQECELQLAKLLPVEDQRPQVYVQRLEKPLDVAYGLLGVPAVVHVHRQRAQAELLDL